MVGTTHVVVIDDNPDDRTMVVRELKSVLSSLLITEVLDETDLETVLHSGAFQLVVTDYELQWSDGLKVLRAVKARYPHCPVIMFTGSGTQEIAVEAMKGGLDDYVVKSSKHLLRLGASVLNCLKAAEATRRASLLEVRQEVLLNRLSVGVFRMTFDGKLLESNPAFLKLMGVGSLHDAQSLDLTPLLLSTAESERLLGLPLDNGHFSHWQAPILNANGEQRWVTVNATLSSHSDLPVVDYVIDDVSEQRRVTEQLQAANAAKDQFLAVLSHELRTPLTPILGVATMLESNEMLPTHLREDVATIRRNAELEARLVDDLLDLSRIEAGKLQCHFEVVDAHEVLRSAWHTCCQGQEQMSESEVHFKLDAVQHYVWADRGRLQQIGWNLFNNAQKFTPASGRIDIRSSNPRPGQLQIEVIDNGFGIEPEVLKRLFNAFEQGPSPVRRAQAGLGLGLTIAKRLAEFHKGTLEARSEGKGKGATFTLILPIAEEATTASKDERSGISTSEAAKRVRILLVDDHADTLRAMARLLRTMGYEITTATNVAEALASANAADFDLLVSDIGLPDATGHDLMRELSKIKPVKGIAVSGFGMDYDLQKSREAGFVEHLVKPVNVDKLHSVIERITQSNVSI